MFRLTARALLCSLTSMKKDTSKATAASNVVRRHKANVKLAERLEAEGWTALSPNELRVTPTQTPVVEPQYTFSNYRQIVDAEPSDACVAIIDGGRTIATLTSDQARELGYFLISRAAQVDIVKAIAKAGTTEPRTDVIREIARKSTMEALRDKHEPR